MIQVKHELMSAYEGTIQNIFIQPGEVIAKDTMILSLYVGEEIVTLTSQIGGQIVSVDVAVGDHVIPGMILGTIMSTFDMK